MYKVQFRASGFEGFRVVGFENSKGRKIVKWVPVGKEPALHLV
jgi:hypothetical protein